LDGLGKQALRKALPSFFPKGEALKRYAGSCRVNAAPAAGRARSEGRGGFEGALQEMMIMVLMRW